MAAWWSFERNVVLTNKILIETSSRVLVFKLFCLIKKKQKKTCLKEIINYVYLKII